ncbi:MAG: LuxR C-terminal-related transcriptional regulator, partial [Acidimicrobiales bacterium]
IKATEVIHARHPKIPVLIFTLSTDEELHRRAESAGARGVLTKDASAAEVISAIATALAPGGGPITPSRPDLMRGGELSLTARELDVLRMITKGASTEAIAAKLYISLKTVKNHLASIYDKLDVADRTQAVLRALRLGLVSLD